MNSTNDALGGRDPMRPGSLMQWIGHLFRNETTPPVDPAAVEEAHRALRDARAASHRAEARRHNDTDQRLNAAGLKIYFAAMEAKADLGRASHESNRSADPR